MSYSKLLRDRGTLGATASSASSREVSDFNQLLYLVSPLDIGQLHYFLRALERVVTTGTPQVVSPSAGLRVGRAQLVRKPSGEIVQNVRSGRGLDWRTGTTRETWTITGPFVDQFVALTSAWGVPETSQALWDAFENRSKVEGEKAKSKIIRVLKSAGLAAIEKSK